MQFVIATHWPMLSLESNNGLNPGKQAIQIRP
jgi:hypothetical protein